MRPPSHRISLRRTPSALTQLRRIVIAVDFSEASLAAANWVAKHLAPHAELIVVHVVPVPYVPTFLRPQVRRSRGTRVSQALSLAGGLRGLASLLGAERTDVELRVGHPALELSEVAEQRDADLIVVGPSAGRNVARRTAHRFAARLLRHARRPTLIVRGATNAVPSSILAAVADERDAPAVLHEAWSLAKACESRVTAVHVISDDVREFLGAQQPARSRQGQAATTLDADLRAATETWLEGQLGAAGIPAGRSDMVVRTGDVGHEILAAARRTEAAIIAVAARRCDRRSLAGDLVGSTTQFLAQSAICPVLVTPVDAVFRTPPSPRSPLRRDVVHIVGAGGAHEDRSDFDSPPPPAAARRLSRLVS